MDDDTFVTTNDFRDFIIKVKKNELNEKLDNEKELTHLRMKRSLNKLSNK